MRQTIFSVLSSFPGIFFVKIFKVKFRKLNTDVTVVYLLIKSYAVLDLNPWFFCSVFPIKYG